MKNCYELFVDYLNEQNYSFQNHIDKDGDGVVAIPFNNKIIKCFFSGSEKEYLSLFQIYESIPEDKVAELIFLCNKLNAQYKWITFYVDKDNDLMLHIDAHLSPETAADEAMEMVARMAKVGKDLKQQIMKVIYS